jgi:Secretory lipase
MRRVCAAGSKVRFLTMSGVGHGMAAARSAGTAVAWIADRFATRPASSDCLRPS